MKFRAENHGVVLLSLLIAFLLSPVGAQPAPPDPNANGNQYPYARFSPSMAIIIVVLITALFFIGFFSIYIRHCSDSSGAAGSVRRALSLRARRTAAARGLDRDVIDTFPTFTYSEVKDHKIGKGDLECAVCLNEFEEDETLRLLPKCDHVFHPECIDAWLESHVTCPVCRADLAPGDEPAQSSAADGGANPNLERNESRIDEVVIQVDENENQQPQRGAAANRSSSFEYPSRPPQSWSVRPTKVFGFGRFRSHSTGHSLVHPGENLERFTLRLPEGVRKEMMTRTGSFAAAAVLPRVGSSRRGYRAGAGEGSSRAGRSYRKMEKADQGTKSDRWIFFTRGLSMRSPRVVAEGEDAAGTSRAMPVKMPSFKCLEPKTADEAGLISGEPGKNPV